MKGQPVSRRSAACKTAACRGAGPTYDCAMPTTVMVVEDEPNIGALVRTYLERAGYQALWVRSGEEALAELRRHPVGW